MYTVIDGICFKNMLAGAYQLVEKKYTIINQLNVFPVPDGDTGNNMLNTLRSMYSMISQDDHEAVGILAEKAAAGAIMGARGNSGVILSQIIHGISRGLHGKKTATCGEMSKAFQYGILYATGRLRNPWRERFFLWRGALPRVRGKFSARKGISARCWKRPSSPERKRWPGRRISSRC